MYSRKNMLGKAISVRNSSIVVKPELWAKILSFLLDICSKPFPMKTKPPGLPHEQCFVGVVGPVPRTHWACAQRGYSGEQLAITLRLWIQTIWQVITGKYLGEDEYNIIQHLTNKSPPKTMNIIKNIVIIRFYSKVYNSYRRLWASYAMNLWNINRSHFN